jgi:HEAT repeat protein
MKVMRTRRTNSLFSILLVIGIAVWPSAWLAAQKAPEAPAKVDSKEPVIEQLVEQLNSQQPAERVVVMQQICALGQEAAPVLPRLVKLLADSTQVQVDGWGRAVRGHTIARLVGMGPVVTDVMLAALDDDDPLVRSGAAEVLGGVRPERAIAPLAERMSDKNVEVANAAATALANYGEPAIDALAKVLADGESSVRTRAAGAISRIPHPRIVRPLAKLLYESDEILRNWAIQSLAQQSYVHQPWFLQQDPSDDEIEAAELQHRNSEQRRALIIAELNAALKSDNLAARIAAAECCDRVTAIDNVAALVDCAASDDAKLREKALRGLAATDHADTFAPLATGMRDANVQVRMAAAAGLSRRASSIKDGKPLISPLLAALRDTDLRVRVSAANALAAIQGDRKHQAVPDLIEALQDASDDVAGAAIHALVRLGDRRAADPLHQVLGRPTMRTKAAIALASFKDPRCLEPLRELLPSNQQDVVRALGMMKDRESVYAITAMLSDSSEWLRRTAADALGEIGDPRAVEPLVERLQSGKPDDFRHVAEALVKIKHPYAIVPLINAASHAALRFNVNQHFFAMAEGPAYNPVARPLYDWGQAAIEPLSEALNSRSSTVRDVAAWVFYEKASYGNCLREELEPVIEPLAAAMDSSTGYARHYAALALAELNDRRSVKVLVEIIAAAGGDHSHLYERAAWFLGEFRDPSTAEPLIKLLQDPNPTARRAAANTLALMRASKAAEPLIPLLKDKYPKVREAAASALGTLKLRAAVGPLLPLLADKRQAVRIAAADALGRIGDKAAVESLAKLAGDDFPVQVAAAIALARLDDPRGVERIAEFLKLADSKQRELAAEQLSGSFVRNASLVKPLAAGLDDPALKVRQDIASALGHVNNDAAVAALLAKTSDRENLPRILHALIGTKNGRAYDALVGYSKDPESDIRNIAAYGIGELARQDSADLLIKLLADPSAGVRINAVDGLGKLRGKASLDALKQALKDEDADVRSRAARAIKKMESTRM